MGNFDAEVEPGAHDMEVWLQEGEMIRPDAARLFRSRPPNWQNPLATTEGQPGVSFRWLEVEGPLYDQWPTAGHRLLFGDLPLQASTRPDLPVEVVSAEPEEDAARLLERFLTKIYRHADGAGQGPRFLPVIRHARETGSSFTEAMLAGYTAVTDPREYMQKVKLMCDMARLAFETDSTRSVTLMLDSVNSPVIDVNSEKMSDAYHSLSHHGKSDEKLRQTQVD